MTKNIFESVNVNRDNWETPPEIFEPLNREFMFTLDPCCRVETAKAGKYYTIHQNGLLYEWRGEVVFVNPPIVVGVAWSFNPKTSACLGVLAPPLSSYSLLCFSS